MCVCVCSGGGGVRQPLATRLTQPAFSLGCGWWRLRSAPLRADSPPPQAVDTLSSFCGKVVPIKKLLLWVEMARQALPEGAGKIPLAAWHTVLQDLSS